MTELKRCPFCGGRAVIEKKRTFLGLSCWHIGCLWCGFNQHFPSEQAATDAWNKRHLLDCEEAAKQSDGKCLGYAYFDDDFPVEQCLNCEERTGYKEV